MTFSLAFQDRIEDWTAYECVNSTIDLDAQATVRRVPPRLASNVSMQGPASVSICPLGTAQFSVDVTGTGPFTYQWRRNGAPLADGATQSGSVISGASTADLRVDLVTQADAGSFDCLVSNNCTIVASSPATLTIDGCCPADFDGDGFVTGLDFDAYLAAFESGDPASDLDDDGFVTGLDFDAFVQAFEAGC